MKVEGIIKRSSHINLTNSVCLPDEIDKKNGIGFYGVWDLFKADNYAQVQVYSYNYTSDCKVYNVSFWPIRKVESSCTTLCFCLLSCSFSSCFTTFISRSACWRDWRVMGLTASP